MFLRCISKYKDAINTRQWFYLVWSFFRQNEGSSISQTAKGFLCFVCSEFDRWPIMEGRAALAAFCFSLFALPHVHGVNCYCFRQHLYWHSAGFPHFLIGCTGFHLSNTQFCTLKYTQKHLGVLNGFLALFVCSEVFRTSLEERSNPPVLIVPSPHFTSCLERNEVTASYIKVSRHMPCCPTSKQTGVCFSVSFLN